MVPHVLGVGYAYNEYEVTAGRWKEFEIEFDYAIILNKRPQCCLLKNIYA